MAFKRAHNVPPWAQELQKSLAWIGLKTASRKPQKCNATQYIQSAYHVDFEEMPVGGLSSEFLDAIPAYFRMTRCLASNYVENGWSNCASFGLIAAFLHTMPYIGTLANKYM